MDEQFLGEMSFGDERKKPVLKNGLWREGRVEMSMSCLLHAMDYRGKVRGTMLAKLHTSKLHTINRMLK